MKLKFFACCLPRDQSLKDTEYRCLFSIGSVHMKSDADAHALRRFEQALQVARHGNKKFDEADALNMLGKVLHWTCSERVIHLMSFGWKCSK